MRKNKWILLSIFFLSVAVVCFVLESRFFRSVDGQEPGRPEDAMRAANDRADVGQGPLNTTVPLDKATIADPEAGKRTADVEVSVDSLMSAIISEQDRTMYLLQLKASWEQEDALAAQRPTYSALREAIVPEARAALTEAGTNINNPTEVASLVDKYLNMFWKDGGFRDETAYHNGCLALAIGELALETHPDSFALLDVVRRAMLTITPLRRAKENYDASGMARLAEILNSQRDIALSPSSSVSPKDAHIAMVDWVYFNKTCVPNLPKEEFVPVLEWMVGNARKQGWYHLNNFEETLSQVKAGEPLGLLPPYVFRNATATETMQMLARSTNRLPSYMSAWPGFSTRGECVFRY